MRLFEDDMVKRLVEGCTGTFLSRRCDTMYGEKCEEVRIRNTLFGQAERQCEMWYQRTRAISDVCLPDTRTTQIM
jgi:hypothetical protein